MSDGEPVADTFMACTAPVESSIHARAKPPSSAPMEKSRTGGRLTTVGGDDGDPGPKPRNPMPPGATHPTRNVTPLVARRVGPG